MQVSRTTRKIGPGASQRPCASLGFDERNRLAFGHCLTAVLALCSRQRRGQLEPDDLAFNDGCRNHDTSVRKEADQHKRRGHPPHPCGFALAARNLIAQQDLGSAQSLLGVHRHTASVNAMLTVSATSPQSQCSTKVNKCGNRKNKRNGQNHTSGNDGREQHTNLSNWGFGIP
jgi:hypothetical protein